jgi:hypothetical protein
LAAGIYFATESAPKQESIAAAALRGLALPDADGRNSASINGAVKW